METLSNGRVEARRARLRDLQRIKSAAGSRTSGRMLGSLSRHHWKSAATPDTELLIHLFSACRSLLLFPAHTESRTARSGSAPCPPGGQMRRLSTRVWPAIRCASVVADQRAGRRLVEMHASALRHRARPAEHIFAGLQLQCRRSYRRLHHQIVRILAIGGVAGRDQHHAGNVAAARYPRCRRRCASRFRCVPLSPARAPATATPARHPWPAARQSSRLRAGATKQKQQTMRNRMPLLMVSAFSGIRAEQCRAESPPWRPASDRSRPACPAGC